MDRLAVVQGVYYLVAGLWPLVSMRTFEKVTGPKVDDWLVRTVGVLVAAIGGTLLAAGARRRVTPETVLLAASSAAGLGAIEVRYAAGGRISTIYLLDALAEAGLVALWLGGGRSWRAANSVTPARRSSRSSTDRAGSTPSPRASSAR